MNLSLGEQRLVRHDAADLVLADQIFSCDDANHALALFCFSSVDALQLSVSDWRIKNTRIQRPAYRRNIVEINTLATNV